MRVAQLDDRLFALEPGEDSLSPKERRAALRLFRPTELEWSPSASAYRASKEVPEEPRTKVERRFQPAPLVTPAKAVAGVAILVGAFFAGRWWARRQKAKKPAGKIGLDVFAAG